MVVLAFSVAWGTWPASTGALMSSWQAEKPTAEAKATKPYNNALILFMIAGYLVPETTRFLTSQVPHLVALPL